MADCWTSAAVLAACCASVADPKLLVCCLDFRNSPKQLRNTSNASESNKSNCIIDGSNLLKIPRRGGLCDKLAMVDQELQPPPKPTAQLLSLRELCLRTLKRWMSRVDSVLPVLQFAQEVQLPDSPAIIEQCTKFIIASFEVMLEHEGQEALENAIGAELVASLVAEAAEVRRWKRRVRGSIGTVVHHGPSSEAFGGTSESSEAESSTCSGVSSCDSQWQEVWTNQMTQGRPTSPRYTYEELKQGATWPPGVEPERREAYLSSAEFQRVFKMNAADFEALPTWRKKLLKQEAMML